MGSTLASRHGRARPDRFVIDGIGPKTRMRRDAKCGASQALRRPFSCGARGCSNFVGVCFGPARLVLGPTAREPLDKPPAETSQTGHRAKIRPESARSGPMSAKTDQACSGVGQHWPGTDQIWPVSTKGAPSSATLDQAWSGLGQRWLGMDRIPLGRWPEFRQIRPSSARSQARLGPESAKIHPESAKRGHILAKLDRTWFGVNRLRSSKRTCSLARFSLWLLVELVSFMRQQRANVNCPIVRAYFLFSGAPRRAAQLSPMNVYMVGFLVNWPCVPFSDPLKTKCP